MSATSREKEDDEKDENQLDSPPVDDEEASGVDEENDDTLDEVGVAAAMAGTEAEMAEDGVPAAMECVGDEAGDWEVTTLRSEADDEVVSGDSAAAGE